MKLPALFVACALLSGVANAQVDTRDGARDEARKFYTQGVAHMQRKDYAAAHTAFAKANALYEASTIKLQYARCLEQEGQVEEAKAMLRDLVAHPPQLSDSQPLKDAYAKGITELGRLETQYPRPVELPAPAPPQPGPMLPPAGPHATHASPKPAVPAQPAYDPNAKPAAAPPPQAPFAPASAPTPVEPVRGVMASGSPSAAPAPQAAMLATSPPPPSVDPSANAHRAGILLGADLGAATGDSRTDLEGVVGLHGGVYVLRHLYAGGRIGWYGSAGKNARSSSQHFEFGVRTDDNGSGISVAGLVGARKVETWSELAGGGNTVSSSTQTEIGLVAGKRFVLGQAFYVSPEVALMYATPQTGTAGTPQFVNGSIQYVGATSATPPATRIYAGVSGEFHIGL